MYVKIIKKMINTFTFINGKIYSERMNDIKEKERTIRISSFHRVVRLSGILAERYDSNKEKINEKSFKKSKIF